MTNIVGVFSSIADAERAIADIQAQGVSSDNIHLIAGNDKNQHDDYLNRSKQESASTASSAASSASFGGGVGIVASLIALAIPGVGPIIAAGPMATVLTGLGIGAAGGGLLGAFKQVGMEHEEAPLYEEAVRRGSILVIVQVEGERADESRRLMQLHGATDVRDEADTWKQKGWTGPSADPHPFTSDSSIRSREMPEEVRTSTSGSDS